ncbi:MAG TPA: type I 3-dehydroquinate dehydratase [Pyrinomonadaceae bacterium]|jgi:3-dehydroquinate dehydratase/shikimate dehydrogenase|nr:type I 3-dehydroquinate dehydratase [Pyrinomonadaceae bacterium]
MAKADLIATLMAPPSPSGAELSALPGSVGSLEIRADLIGDLNPEWLRANFKGQLIYALRSKDAGGESSDSPSERQRRFQKAAHHYDRVELEANKDCSPELLTEIPAGQRLISRYGPAGDLAELKARFAQIASVPAANYKLICRSKRISDEFTPLALLKSLARSDTIAYAEGPMGFWSRLVALHLGAPAIYGAMPHGAPVPGEPTINKLIDDYGLPELRPTKEIFAIIGSPVFHSLSPRLHNAAYREMKYPGLFLPLHVESFDEFWEAVVRSRVFDSLGFSLNGMTVASPHKEAALRTANSVSPMARQAESANILVRNNGYWSADTTDPEVIYMATRERNVKVDRKRAAVIGCGGAGRAIAAALVQSGAGVTLVNRGAERGSHAAELLSLPYLPLPNFDAEGFDIVVNATPVGRDTDEVPFKVDRLSDGAVIIDLVYGTRPTSLVDSTLGREQIVIDGRDVLLTQVLRQFQMMTGKDMSPIIAPETLRRTTTVATADVAQTVGLPSS